MRKAHVGVVAALAGFAGGPVLAQQPAEPEEPVVVEMFLSQSCTDSVPAAEVQRELSRRPDIVALTWHIDYWNVLASRKHGRWEDPFAAAAFSARQRIYNRNIRDRGTVFTPQAIVNGTASEIGSRRKDIEQYIAMEREERRDGVRTSMRRVGGRIEAEVNQTGNDPRDVLLVRFAAFAATHVQGGDNFGLTFEERNVVRTVEKLGVVRHEPETFVFDAPAEGQGCAVLVQHMGQGPIVAARYCP